MGYCGVSSSKSFHEDPLHPHHAGRAPESHPHDVTITKEAPNYGNSVAARKRAARRGSGACGNAALFQGVRALGGDRRGRGHAGDRALPARASAGPAKK